MASRPYGYSLLSIGRKLQVPRTPSATSPCNLQQSVFILKFTYLYKYVA